MPLLLLALLAAFVFCDSVKRTLDSPGTRGAAWGRPESISVRESLCEHQSISVCLCAEHLCVSLCAQKCRWGPALCSRALLCSPAALPLGPTPACTRTTSRPPGPRLQGKRCVTRRQQTWSAHCASEASNWLKISKIERFLKTSQFLKFLATNGSCCSEQGGGKAEGGGGVRAREAAAFARRLAWQERQAP